VVSELEIDLLTAITGGELRVTSPVGGAVLRAVVPPNVQPGHRIRFKGRGRASRAGGGGPGDLYLEVVVRPHPFYHRDGLDLVLELPLTVEEAWRGASVDIPTLAGWLRVPIPAGSRGGERLRLRGKGIYDGELAGDLYVHLCVRLPDRLEAAGRSLERLAGLYSDDVRQGLHL
jgi:curved DNA-binding protein